MSAFFILVVSFSALYFILNREIFGWIIGFHLLILVFVFFLAERDMEHSLFVQKSFLMGLSLGFVLVPIIGAFIQRLSYLEGSLLLTEPRGEERSDRESF